MELLHNHKNCPSCHSKLEGNENNCPFCGYRIVLEDIKEAEASHNEEKILLPDIENNITSETTEEKVSVSLNATPVIEEDIKEEYVSPEINKIETDNEINTEFENTAKTPLEENDEIQKQPENIGSTENKHEEISLSNEFEGKDNKPVYKRPVYIISALIAASIIVFGILLLMQYNNKINIGILSKMVRSAPSKTTVVAPVTTKAYYYCYSLGKVKGKNIIVLSKIFNLTGKEDNEASATKKYNDAVKKVKTLNSKYFKTTICKKYSSIETAYKEKDKLIKTYLKLDFDFSFVDVNLIKNDK